MGAVGQAVHDGGGQPAVWEHGAPLAEGQVGRHRDRRPLVPLGDDLEQELRAPGVQMDM